MKGILTILGLGMIALWAVGLAVSPTTPFMTWLDGAAGLISFFEAGAMPGATRAARSSAIILLSLGLFGVFLGGYFYGAVAWQVWWTLGAAGVYFVLGIVAGFTGPQGAIIEERREEPPRRVA